MNNRRIWIGVAVVAGLVLLFFVGREFLDNQAERKRQEEAAAKVQEAQLALGQLRTFADGIGIDTARFVAAPTATFDEVEDKTKRLLMEIRYGKKPSRITFAGLSEKVDSSWTESQPYQPDQVVQLAKGSSSFGPYAKLIAHYQRLRGQSGSNPAVADSLRLLRQTLNFYRYLNRFNMDRFVLVNIPAAELNVYDRAGKSLMAMHAIVGKPDKKTPCMTTYIKDIVAYPYWNVPKNIAINEMLPRIRKNLDYLYSQNLQVLDERGKEVDPEEVDWESLSETNFPYRIRQASGCENALGLIKFDLENPLAIYLHDTNGRDLFTLTKDRWRSHGCVRVQKPVELANFVLGEAKFDKGFMDRCLIDQKPQTLKIPKPFPVFIAYNTADVDATGQLRFYKDIYALDR
ncbi:ErfK/YbiS/YcfS/YnhG family protein [Fibrisoma limi BUZ 3]|uniref:ErfK/YbiS/YcfS/YnhG family protein n=1 Tax=Fibrisoma limi BUZ 3 TaxID=1185876 RepID=I2GM95_9BACT|nr:L,D-transpeptidase family protein [Fibrisoma limi]CCH55022.1 ErfK/YbiS/YcfS/YnhG family protein [Fibrisoma limi BUZ 3]